MRSAGLRGASATCCVGFCSTLISDVPDRRTSLRQGAHSFSRSSAFVLWLWLLSGGDMHVLSLSLVALMGLRDSDEVG